MPSVCWQEIWTVWQAVSLAVMPSRPFVCLDPSAPLLVPGGRSSAGLCWHGLARCGGWHGLATCGGSPARSTRPIATRPGAAIAAPTGGPIVAPASLLCLLMWQWAELAEVSAARVAAARAAAAM
eukprot:scaffold100519_cov54-Phaeocystis_antarctica.AAC.5